MAATPNASAHAAPATGAKSGMADAAMIVGILSIPALLIPILAIILGIVAIVLGAVAKGEIRKRAADATPVRPTAGIVCGAIGHRRRDRVRRRIVASSASWLPRTASTDSSVSACAAGLSGRWRTTRANRSATPPG